VHVRKPCSWFGIHDHGLETMTMVWKPWPWFGNHDLCFAFMVWNNEFLEVLTSCNISWFETMDLYELYGLWILFSWFKTMNHKTYGLKPWTCQSFMVWNNALSKVLVWIAKSWFEIIAKCFIGWNKSKYVYLYETMRLFQIILVNNLIPTRCLINLLQCSWLIYGDMYM
jgi:hypothetical protein